MRKYKFLDIDISRKLLKRVLKKEGMTMWIKFSWHRLDTMREREFFVYLSDYELFNKDFAPRI
jgi:hypothetical protein